MEVTIEKIPIFIALWEKTAHNGTKMSSTSESPTPSRVFPETQTLWISDRLSEGDSGLLLANGNLMARYVRPLTSYCRTIGLARSIRMEADDVVHGFFANRLGNAEYLKSWMSSGLRLRQWLRNGLHMYVHEQRRAKAGHAGGHAGGQAGADAGTVGLPDEVPSMGAAHDREFERAWALSTLDLAMRETKDGLEKRGRLDEWEMFWSHHVDGVAHARIGERFQLSAAQVAQRAYAVGAQLRDSLCGILRKDGALIGEIDKEVRSMMEVLHELRS